jgi:hypothetical protein
MVCLGFIVSRKSDNPEQRHLVRRLFGTFRLNDMAGWTAKLVLKCIDNFVQACIVFTQRTRDGRNR